MQAPLDEMIAVLAIERRVGAHEPVVDQRGDVRPHTRRFADALAQIVQRLVIVELLPESAVVGTRVERPDGVPQAEVLHAVLQPRLRNARHVAKSIVQPALERVKHHHLEADRRPEPLRHGGCLPPVGDERAVAVSGRAPVPVVQADAHLRRTPRFAGIHKRRRHPRERVAVARRAVVEILGRESTQDRRAVVAYV